MQGWPGDQGGLVPYPEFTDAFPGICVHNPLANFYFQLSERPSLQPKRAELSHLATESNLEYRASVPFRQLFSPFRMRIAQLQKVPEEWNSRYFGNPFDLGSVGVVQKFP